MAETDMVVPPKMAMGAGWLEEMLPAGSTVVETKDVQLFPLESVQVVRTVSLEVVRPSSSVTLAVAPPK